MKQKTKVLKVTDLAADDYVVSWELSNPKIATISGKPNGTCSITAGKKTGKAVLRPVIIPLSSTEKISYKSSNSKIVTVNGKGQITAKKKGTAVITVKSGKKSVKCKVTVK